MWLDGIYYIYRVIWLFSVLKTILTVSGHQSLQVNWLLWFNVKISYKNSIAYIFLYCVAKYFPSEKNVKCVWISAVNQNFSDEVILEYYISIWGGCHRCSQCSSLLLCIILRHLHFILCKNIAFFSSNIKTDCSKQRKMLPLL